MTVPTFTLAGTTKRTHGPAMVGGLTVKPSTVLRDIAGKVILAGPVPVTPADGVWSVDLPAPGPDVRPESFSYTIEHDFDVHLDDVTFTAPAAGTTLYEADIATSATPDAPASIYGLQGAPGPAGPDAVQAGGLAGAAVQGLYTRTKPAPTGATTGFYALAKDPAVATRVWGNGLDFSTLGFTDNNGATYTPKTLHPGSGAMHQLLFTATHAWLVTGSNSDRNGQVWRSPLPDASGNGLVWTLKFDLASPPSGLAAGVNSFFRPQCLAVSGTNVYLLEYGTTVTGGPSIYYSASNGDTPWTKPKTWANAKHGHAIHVINGAPVVMLGDASFTDLGLWRASATNGTGPWTHISLYGEALGGNTRYGINFVPVTRNGGTRLFVEYDGDERLGPLVFPGPADGPTFRPLQRTFEMPSDYPGTMRCLTLTSEGNLMWVWTTENGALGPHDDTVWISKPPFTSAVLIDSFAPSTMFLGDPVEVGNYVWFGYYLCRKELFA